MGGPPMSSAETHGRTAHATNKVTRSEPEVLRLIAWQKRAVDLRPRVRDSGTSMPPHRPRLSVVAHTLSPDPRVAPRLAREFGFEGVLFDACPPALDLPSLSGTGRREFRSVVSGQNQQLVGLRLDLGQQGFGLRGDVDRELARLDKAMDAAKGLGAPLVCVDLGPLPEPERAPKPKPA